MDALTSVRQETLRETETDTSVDKEAVCVDTTRKKTPPC